MKNLGFAAIAGAVVFGAGMLAPTDSRAVVVETILNQTIEVGESFEFSLNDDDINDFVVSILEPNFEGDDDTFELATIEGLAPPELVVVGPPGPVAASVVIDDDDFEAGNNVFVENSESEFAKVFQPGDEVDGEDTSAFSAILYSTEFNPSGEGPFSEIGATGFVGLEMIDFDGIQTLGWIEITRGSIIVSRSGVQNVAGASAPIPLNAIPVPPAIALMASAVAVFGFVARRRR